MEIIVFEKDAYYKMIEELMSMVKTSVKEAKDETYKEKYEIDWIDDKEVKALLNIRSKARLQQLRSAGDIEFTKYGRKIQYSKKSVIAYLNKNKRRF